MQVLSSHQLRTTHQINVRVWTFLAWFNHRYVQLFHPAYVSAAPARGKVWLFSSNLNMKITSIKQKRWVDFIRTPPGAHLFGVNSKNDSLPLFMFLFMIFFSSGLLVLVTLKLFFSLFCEATTACTSCKPLGENKSSWREFDFPLNYSMLFVTSHCGKAILKFEMPDACCILTSVQAWTVNHCRATQYKSCQQKPTVNQSDMNCKVFCSSSSSAAVEDSRPLKRLCLRLFHASIHTCAYLCDFLHLGGRGQWGRLTAVNGSVCRVLGSLAPVWVCVNSGGLYGRPLL